MQDKHDYQLIGDQADVENPLSEKMPFRAEMRLGFIRKVYGILSFQLLFTILMCTLSIGSPTFLQFQMEHFWLFIIALLVTICLPCSILCFDNLLKRVPDNYIFLSVFTLCESYIVSVLCGITNTRVVIMAAIMTFAISFSLTLYAITTKTDFTFSGALLFILGTALLMFSIFAIFTQNKVIHIVISTLWMILLGIYLVYDTQLIVGNQANLLSEDDYILASFMLYVDIIAIFIQLLKLIGLLAGDSQY
jgi:FtsH-binding integral membrane protein